MVLNDIGLTNNELEVYKTLLREGFSLASQIIKKTSLHRGTVYDILERLVQKGLASHISINKKKMYEALPPEKLLEIIKEKKDLILKEELSTRKIVEDLNKLRNSTVTSNIKVLVGKEGLKNLMCDILNYKEFLSLGGEKKFKEYLPIYTVHWAKEREKKKIYARLMGEFPADTKWKYNKYKMLPKGLRFPVSTIIYGNKVAILLPEEPLKIVLIESEKTYNSYKSEFEILWNSNRQSRYKTL